MLFTPHILTGMAIGMAEDDWWWIIFLSLVFHVVLDMIPHADISYQKSREYYLWSCLDLLVGWIMVMWLTNGLFSTEILLGIIISILPDILSFIILKGRWQKFYWYLSWHKKIQTDWPAVWGWLSQILVVAILIWWRFYLLAA